MSAAVCPPLGDDKCPELWLTGHVMRWLSQRIPTISISIGVLLLLGAGVFTLTRSAMSSNPSPTPEISSDTTPQAPHVPSVDDTDPYLRALAEDNAKPDFSGRLGPFTVTPGRADNEIPCSATWDKDLYTPQLVAMFGSANAAGGPCGAEGFDDGTELRRRFFGGSLKVPFQAPEERIKLMTIAGRPAVVELPAIPVLPSRVVVIERFPGGEPGIFAEITVLPAAGGLDRATEVVERLRRPLTP